MVKMSGPSGWNPHEITTRFVTTSPRSFNARTRTVDCIVSTGAPVARVYGVEILTISRDAVNIDRVTSRMCPLLDSHRTDHISQALGMVTQAWVERGALMATLAFNQTPEGDAALGMVSRGEIAGISAGYRVREWMCTDEDGVIIDQEATRWREGLTFTAVEWELLEISICAVPADSSAGIRDFSNHLTDIRARMRARQAMSDRMSLWSSNSGYLQ